MPASVPGLRDPGSHTGERAQMRMGQRIWPMRMRKQMHGPGEQMRMGQARCGRTHVPVLLGEVQQERHKPQL